MESPWRTSGICACLAAGDLLPFQGPALCQLETVQYLPTGFFGSIIKGSQDGNLEQERKAAGWVTLKMDREIYWGLMAQGLWASLASLQLPPLDTVKWERSTSTDEGQATGGPRKQV